MRVTDGGQTRVKFGFERIEDEYCHAWASTVSKNGEELLLPMTSTRETATWKEKWCNARSPARNYVFTRSDSAVRSNPNTPWCATGHR